jgi:hypothetical protein
MLSACVAVLLAASVTFTVNEDVPDPVGVPEITPDDPFRTNPAGNVPLLMLQVYGVVPPVACAVAEYADPSVPLGREPVDMDSDRSAPEWLGAPTNPAQPASAVLIAQKIEIRSKYVAPVFPRRTTSRAAML